MQKNVVYITPSKLYRDLPAPIINNQKADVGWIRGVSRLKADGMVKDLNDVFGKRFVRIKAVQIKLEVEDLEVENRQIKTALSYIREVNSDLKNECELEESEMGLVWNKTLKTNRETIKTGKYETPTLRARHLTKNLRFQIYLSEKEMRKVDKNFESLKNTEEYYQYVENSVLNKVYREDVDRLESLKVEPEITLEIIPKKTFDNILKKIRRTDRQLQKMECAKTEKQSEIQQTEIDLNDKNSKNQKLEYFLKRLVEENEQLKKSTNLKMKEYEKMKARVDTYKKYIETTN